MTTETMPFSGVKRDRRTLESRELEAGYREVAAQLGTVAPGQARHVERVAMLRWHLAQLDSRALKAGGLSQDETDLYARLTGTLHRAERALGLKARPAPLRAGASLEAHRAASKPHHRGDAA
jgi:hypothetical protein